MFCPQCGSNQSDELKFCKSCGTNMESVRTAVVTRDAGGKFDWNKTWIAEMMLSHEEVARRTAEMKRLRGITPETNRRNEIKAGVITGSVGVGLMITIFMVMQGIILGGFVSQAVAEILSRVWIAGIIPIFVGAALIVNGVFISKKGQGSEVHETDAGMQELPGRDKADFLPPAGTNQLGSSIPFSVTDETTQHLAESAIPKSESKKAN